MLLCDAEGCMLLLPFAWHRKLRRKSFEKPLCNQPVKALAAQWLV
jgi:hypothetical protein